MPQRRKGKRKMFEIIWKLCLPKSVILIFENCFFLMSLHNNALFMPNYHFLYDWQCSVFSCEEMQ